MNLREIRAKSVLNSYGKIDSWFISRYGMNLYRGCEHNCAYCDGRAENYFVEGEFGHDLAVKVNALEVLGRELPRIEGNMRTGAGFIMIGGGVGDSYQPVEERYRLTRRVLQLLREFGYPAHVLTKSTLVLRDIDILKEINQRSRAMVSFSFSSMDEGISAIFEPGVPSPGDRLKALIRFKREGLACGMFLLPLIPYITDLPDMVEECVARAAEAKLDCVIFGGMTLKDGRQRAYFFRVLEEYYPSLVPEYHNLYRNGERGNPEKVYSEAINMLFGAIARKYRLPLRIPPSVYGDVLKGNDRVVVILEHMDYLLRMMGKPSPYGRAAYSISRLKEPLSSRVSDLRGIRGVGKVTERIIREILETGSSSYYRDLMVGSA